MGTFFPCVNLPVGFIYYAFRESNMAGKGIVILLFVGSIIAWSIMLSKYIELRRAYRISGHFLNAFRKEANPVALYLSRRRVPESPLWHLYQQGCLALSAELDQGEQDGSLEGNSGTLSRPLTGRQLDHIQQVIERRMADQALLLEDKMGLLAMTVSASPLLGLLGTVWGVLDAFVAMAVTGGVTLRAVAPGLAGALLTTVVGLLVALPSSLGYNLLATYIRRLCVQMENFGQEFQTALERTFGGE